MPTYEYQCQVCGHYMEEFQKISDAPLIRCPECGKNKLQKQVSASAFHLKGGGWYVTDFKDKPKKEDKAEQKSASETTKTETKAEAKQSTETSSSIDSKATKTKAKTKTDKN